MYLAPREHIRPFLKISQNDFIVHNLFCLDSSAPMTTLTKEVVQMKFAKLFVDANVNRKKAE